MRQTKARISKQSYSIFESIMSTNSFQNFLTDILVRSIESHDWISEEMENLDLQVEQDLKDISTSQIRALRTIYDSMVLRLTKMLNCHIIVHS